MPRKFQTATLHAAPRQSVVVIPLYTLSLTALEVSALRHNLQVLAGHDIVVVKPESLDVTSLPVLLAMEPCWDVEHFPDSFFESREGYNHLMLSSEFYERFLHWEYLLVLQTDVLLFDNRLTAWCRKGYDYVGAPWLPDPRAITGFYPLHRMVWWCRRTAGRLLPGFHAVNLKWRVGNGGFSLRRVATFYRVAHDHRETIARMAADNRRVENFEDVFWSVTANRLWPDALNIAPWREALDFAVETHPDTALRYTCGRLPMGAHAYWHYRNEWSHYVSLSELLDSVDN